MFFDSNVNDTAIFDKLRVILREHTSIRGDITEETALLADNIIDSMDFMNYLTAVEEIYKLAISNEDVADRKLGVVGNMVAYIRERTS